MFFFRSHIISNLNIRTLTAPIYHKIHFQLFMDPFSLFIFIIQVDKTYIYVVSSAKQFIINNIFHNMHRFLLSEVQPGIS